MVPNARNKKKPHLLRSGGKGGCGAGKSHLLRGLEADAARRRPGAALYLSARAFTQRYVGALRTKEISEFANRRLPDTGEETFEERESDEHT